MLVVFFFVDTSICPKSDCAKKRIGESSILPILKYYSLKFKKTDIPI